MDCNCSFAAVHLISVSDITKKGVLCKFIKKAILFKPSDIYDIDIYDTDIYDTDIYDTDIYDTDINSATENCLTIFDP